MTNIQAIKNSISKLLIHPLLWRVTGFGSSVVGFSCYALSPSFPDLFGKWTPLKIVIYSVVSSLFSILMLFVKRCSWGPARSFVLKAHVGFLVLMLTSLWSLLEDHTEEEGKVEKGYGKVMKLTSGGAFAMMALSLSRQLELTFEVGVFNFLIGSFLVTVMKMNLKLAPLAAFFCYLLVNIRSISDFLLKRVRGATQQHVDDIESNSLDQVTFPRELYLKKPKVKVEEEEEKKNASNSLSPVMMKSKGFVGSPPSFDLTFDEIEPQWEASSEYFNLQKFPSYEIDWDSL